MVLIEAQEPWTVALGILLSFYFDFILVLPYFCFRSVLSKLWASSRSLSEAMRATQRLQNWRYIAATATIIGAAWHSALIGEAGERSPHLQAKRGEFLAPMRCFRGFFLCSLRFTYWQSTHRRTKVLALHKENERIGKAQTTIHSASPIIEIAY